MNILSAIGTTAGTLENSPVLHTIADTIQRINASAQDTSLVEFTKVGRVEPLCVVGSDCVNLEYISDVLQSLQSIFTGYYLRALSILGNVQSVKAVKLLDQLNPSRSAKAKLFGFSTENHQEPDLPQMDWRMAKESYRHRLPTTKNQLALESELDRISTTLQDSGKNTIDAQVNQLTNLSIGKQINVEIQAGQDKEGKPITVKVPLAIRLLVTQVPERTLEGMMTLKSSDTSFSARWDAWRSGRIGFFRDLVMCQDLIDEHKKNLINDKEGVYSKIVNRANQSKMAGFMEKNPSLNVASNLIVMSEATAQAIADKLGGKFSSSTVRDKVFQLSYAMIVVVIDRSWERVTFYHRGIKEPTTLGLRDIKISNKGNGPDLADILKAYTMGTAPSL